MRKPVLYAVLDQALLSAFNFALSFALIRIWSDKPEVFGIYSVVLAASLALISVQNALVNAQFTNLRPQAKTEDEEAILLSMFWTVNIGVMFAALITTFILILVDTSNDYELASSAALFVGATLAREYTRSHHFSYMNVRALLVLDCVSVAISVVFMAIAYTSAPALGLPVLFVILALGQILATVLAIRPDRAHYRLVANRQTTTFYREVWRRHSFWALLGVLTSEFQQRGYVFVVAAVFGVGSVALLQAAALLFRPIQLITHAWGKLARAVLAGHFARHDVKSARAFTLKSFAILVGLYLAFAAVLWGVWPFISDILFQGRYAGLGDIVVLWGIASAVIIIGGIFSLEAQTLALFKQLSFGAGLGALVCALVLGVVVMIGDFRVSVFAVIAGQLTYLAVIVRLLLRTTSTPAVHSDMCVVAAVEPIEKDACRS